jgi:hypothetical protein
MSRSRTLADPGAASPRRLVGCLLPALLLACAAASPPSTPDGGADAGPDGDGGDGGQIGLPPPVVDSFSPAGGVPGQRTRLTIEGRNFVDQQTAVSFASASGESWVDPRNGGLVHSTSAPDRVLYVWPPSDAVTGRLTVSTPWGETSTTSSWTAYRAPAVDFVSPTSGPVGTLVTLHGRGFLGVGSVEVRGLGGDLRVAVTSTSDSELQLPIPELGNGTDAVLCKDSFLVENLAGSALSLASPALFRPLTSATGTLGCVGFADCARGCRREPGCLSGCRAQLRSDCEWWAGDQLLLCELDQGANCLSGGGACAGGATSTGCLACLAAQDGTCDPATGSCAGGLCADAATRCHQLEQ